MSANTFKLTHRERGLGSCVHVEAMRIDKLRKAFSQRENTDVIGNTHHCGSCTSSSAGRPLSPSRIPLDKSRLFAEHELLTEMTQDRG